MTITILLIAVTALISIQAFANQSLIRKFILYPSIMNQPSEYYRLVTSGFIHADWNHLIFNMMTLFFAGQSVEEILKQLLGPAGSLVYLLFYLAAIAIASLPAMIKHRGNPHYSALGASGGVSAVLFFVIYYAPWAGISLYFIPRPKIPAIIFGLLYSLYSYYMAKRGTDNIGHDAHLGGGIFGFIVAFLVDPTHGRYFLQQITHPHFDMWN